MLRRKKPPINSRRTRYTDAEQTPHVTWPIREPENDQSEFPELIGYNETNGRGLRQKENTTRNLKLWQRPGFHRSDEDEKPNWLKRWDWCHQYR